MKAGRESDPGVSRAKPTSTGERPVPASASGAARDLRRLQGAVGNAAVSRLVAQRYVAPVKPSVAQAPGFRRVRSDVAAKKSRLAAHVPAGVESRSAQDAAVAPADDREAQGKAANAEKMNAARPGEFDKAAFIAAVDKAVEAQAPKNLDEADTFSRSGKADKVRGEVDGKVSAGKDSSAKDIATTTKAAPDTSAAKDKPVTPLSPDRPPGNPGAPSARDAVPEKQPAAVTDFSQGPAANDKALADAEVSEEQLARGNEPEFDQALKAKKTAETDSAKAPVTARAAEGRQLDAAKAGAAASGARAMNALTATRASAGRAVDGGKGETKSKDERKRAEVTAKLQRVFDATKKDVEGILSGLDKKVDDAFTAGERSARDAFMADQAARMKKYKEKRYSGFFGKGRWLKDKFAGLPQEANQLYQESRKLYVARMRTVISAVADLIGTELGRAKTRIAKGRTELRAEVDRLPADLRRFGQEAEKDFAGKFEDLEATVDEKSDQLVQDLANKYTAALNKIDEEIKKLQEANKGLIDKAKDAIVGVIKTINELKNLLLGILAKAASAIMKIIKDPIGFLGNLVKAVGAGLKLFVANIADHLKTGVVSWLLGTAVKAGLELPQRFDLRGIIQLIASLLGLTWADIRTRITRKGVPDQALSAVETGIPVARKLAAEGPAGAVDEIRNDVGDLKATILSKLTEYLIPTVIVAGITWILSLLNPASAFVRAVKGIIDIVTFVVNQGAQIAEFVNAVLDAVIQIANGGQAGVPKLIETALATSIPLLIGFLASLLGIGNLANKVKSVFHTVARPVNRAIDKIINLIATQGRALWQRLKGRGKGTGRDKDGRGDKRPKDRRTDDGPRSSADVRGAANKAARQGWRAAAGRAETKVVPRAEVDSALSGLKPAAPGVRVTLSISASGANWRVTAHASAGGRSATAHQGSGWIAKGDGGESWFGAKDHSAFNKTLIEEVFGELRGSGNGPEGEGDLRAGYQHKARLGASLERQQQEKLNARVRGLRFKVSTEPYSGVEKDKKMRTVVSVTPNKQQKREEVEVSGDPFPYTIGNAAADTPIVRVGQARDHLRKVRLPMRGEDSFNGYVINMAARPKEVDSGMASRYLDSAWEGSPRHHVAAASTAVVIGVNEFVRLDPRADGGDYKRDIRQGVQSIAHPSQLRMAAFGFAWTPHWKRTAGGNDRVPLVDVRKAYHRLSPEAKATARQEESKWRDGNKVPYGLFREQVIGSSYTEKAVSLLSEIHDRVHIASQDADGGVIARNGMGVLAAYDKILRAMGEQPMLTIGGYTFEGFDWGEMAGSRTRQLTELANALDRAARVAIAELFPQMLYPPEPNTLIKAFDGSLKDGVFQNAKLLAALARQRGSLYGVGSGEGRTARVTIADHREEDGPLPVVYDPDAAVVTSPVPDNPDRGLTVRPESVRAHARGEAFKEKLTADDRRRHPMYALIVQSQSMTSALNLAREFRLANPGMKSKDQELLAEKIFATVENVAMLLADDPELGRKAPSVERQLELMAAGAAAFVELRPRVESEVGKAGEVAKRVVEAMTADDLKATWRELHILLRDIMKESRSDDRGRSDQ